MQAIESYYATASSLRHSQFTAPQGATGECNDDLISITGRSLRVNGDCDTSQLNVTISSPSVNSWTVECAYSGGETSIVGMSIIDTSRGKGWIIIIVGTKCMEKHA